MTLIRQAGSTAAIVLLAASLLALQDGQQAQPRSDKGCSSLRVVQIPLTDEHMVKPNTIQDTSTTACTNDMVAWHFINPGSRPVEIDLENFRLCDAGTPVKPVKFRGGWFDDDSDSMVPPQSSVTMLGRVTMRGGPQGTCVKYDIDVRERGRARVRHDPRLEIIDP